MYIHLLSIYLKIYVLKLHYSYVICTLMNYVILTLRDVKY